MRRVRAIQRIPSGHVQVELRAWLGTDYVQGSLCGKMPDLMRKDVEKLIAEYTGSRTQPERFTRKEQAAREAAMEAATGSAESAGDASGPMSSPSAAAEPLNQVRPCLARNTSKEIY